MDNANLAAVVFGLGSAAAWGGGDFSGGLATRRTQVTAVLLINQGIGLVLLIAAALLWSEALPAAASLGWAAAAGFAGVIGLAALYRGLAIGRAGLVAPTSAVVAAALPVLFGALTEGLPAATRLAGFALALVGVWLVAQQEGGGQAHGLGLALLAGFGFGVFFILIHLASTTSTFWPLATARAASLPLVLVATLRSRVRPQLPPRTVGLAALSGTLDMVGNALFVLAGQAGRLDVAAVLSSLYPASTVILSRLLLGERISPTQGAGIACALAAIALIAS